jgi:C-terminal processing protease CtpA/Prc
MAIRGIERRSGGSEKSQNPQNFKLPGGYVLRMPVAGCYTWNGECIEGKGVEADVPIENSPESLFYCVVKNSHMAGAVAASPGSLVTPRPSSVRRSTLWC